jgi:hypothetical protein
LAEFKSIHETLEARPGSLGALRSLWLADEQVSVWRMELRGFDGDLAGGKVPAMDPPPPLPQQIGRQLSGPNQPVARLEQVSVRRLTGNRHRRSTPTFKSWLSKHG